MNASIQSEVNALYLGLFDRPADPSGQAYWADQLSLNPTAALNSISTFVNGGAAFTAGTTGAGTIGAEITNIFENLLGRAPLSSGLTYWSDQYTSGAQTIGQIVNSIYNDVENTPSTSVNYIYTEIMNEKLTAAQYFTASYAISGSPSTPSGYSPATFALNNFYTQNMGIITNITTGGTFNYGNNNHNFSIVNVSANITLTAGNGENIIMITGTGNDTITLGNPNVSILDGYVSYYQDIIYSLGTGNDTITLGSSSATGGGGELFYIYGGRQ